MNCTRIESLLDDYVDDELSVSRRLAVEEHLAGCAGCRGSLEELRRLERAVRALPREIAPARDLLPGIRSAAGDRRRGVFPAPAHRLRWVGAAAALVVLVVAIVAGWERRPGGAEGRPGEEAERPAPLSGEAVRAALDAFRDAELQYTRASNQLLQVLEARAEPLAPETRGVLDENLRVIDEALADVRAALEADPGNPRNGHALNALHRQKIQMLLTFSRLVS